MSIRFGIALADDTINQREESSSLSPGTRGLPQINCYYFVFTSDISKLETQHDHILIEAFPINKLKS